MALAFELTENRAPAMGLIVLQTDELVEPEIGPLFQQMGLRTYHCRIPMMPEVRPETLAGMGDEMTRTAAMLPSDMGLAAIGYGCTSGATVLGETKVADLVQAAHPDIPVSNPMSGLKAALKALGVTRLGLLTPYVANVSEALVDTLKEEGIDVTSFGSFEQVEDRTVARIDPRSTLTGIIQVGSGDCEAVFASCTNLRAFEIIEEAEAAIGKPVLCSNQVLAWHMLEIAGLRQPMEGRGQLFRLPSGN